ncbi:MAG TPA: SLC13 family permease [Candidatus Xenobia bacterium]
MLLPIVALSIGLMLVRPRGLPEAWWVCGGALLLVLLRLVPVGLAAQAVVEGTDVYLFLIGMMLLSELARQYGVFDWLSSWALRTAQGSGVRLLGLVYGVGTVVTVLMSNDATAVVLTPAILAAVRKARTDPLPYLFVCALIANAASFVLPISNPANLVVYRGNVPPVGQWLSWFILPSVVSIVVTYGVLRAVFARDLQSVHSDVTAVALTPPAIRVLVGLASVVLVVLIASARGLSLGLPTCLAALATTAVVCAVARQNPLPLFRSISWSTLLLVAGLFVLVDGVVSQGALNATRDWLEAAARLPPAPGTLATGFVVGVANNLVNNLPLGLLAGATVHAAQAPSLLARAVLIGVDLGPNLSVTGSLATILWLIALRREGLDVSFWRFLKVGAIAMPLALLGALLASLIA